MKKTYKELKIEKERSKALITRVHAASLKDEKDFISYAKGFYNLKKESANGFRTLNRKKDAKVFEEEKNILKIEKAAVTGYFLLNSFADCYRRTIKISYGTLRLRMLTKPILLQYLIDKDYIMVYTSNQRTIIVVNYLKRFEFIDLILKSFLNDYQKGLIVK